jgi:AcrR family transcriptional regulator
MPKSSPVNVDSANADQTRKRIHAAVIECVERWGIEKTTLNDIAKTAGISRQTVYNYFPGKAEVLESALDEAGRAFMERVEAHATRFDDPAECLLESLLYTITELPKEPYLHVLVEPAFFLTFMQEFFGSELSRERVQAVTRACLRNAPELLPQVEEISEITSRFLMSVLITDGGVKRSEAQMRGLIQRRILPGLVPSANKS